MTFDLGHVLVLAWEKPREQAVSVNEGHYLALPWWTWSYSEAKRQATGRRKKKIYFFFIFFFQGTDTLSRKKKKVIKKT